MNAAEKTLDLTIRPRSSWRRSLLFSFAAFGVTFAVVALFSQKYQHNTGVIRGSKAVAVVDRKPANDEPNLSKQYDTPITSPNAAENIDVQLPANCRINLNNIKTRMSTPGFIFQALCDGGIDTSHFLEIGEENNPYITLAQILHGLNVRLKTTADRRSRQIIMELSLNKSPDSAKIVRALADRLVREYRTFWSDEIQEAYQAASSRTYQAQQAHRQAVETLLAFEEKLSAQENNPLPPQPEKKRADRQSTATNADNPTWIELERKLKSLERQETTLLEKKTPLHPDVQNIRAKISDIELQIASTPRYADESPKIDAPSETLVPSRENSLPLSAQKNGI
jgi:hypothetical protein